MPFDWSAYNASPAGKAAQKKWRQSEKGRINAKIRRERYFRDHPERRKVIRDRWLMKSDNKKRVNRNRVLKRHGLNREAWEILFTQQGRVCGACGTDDPGSKLGWMTDHDHTTGQLRKVLCNGCNFALGHTKDSIPRLRALISYLEAHGRR